MHHPPTRAIRHPPVWQVTLAIVAIAVCLRSPFVAVAPISGALQSQLSLNAAQVGLLTSLPVLCFALLTPLVSPLVGRVGANLTTTALLLGVALGILIRSAGGVPALYAGTIVLGAFIAIGNVVLPVIIRRDVPPTRVPLVTGIYTSALNIGTMIATAATAPLEARLGWPVALGVWSIVALAAFAVWMLVLGARSALHWGPVQPAVETDAVVAINATPVPDAIPERTFGSLTAVLLAIAFAGQAFGYYAVTAWLPGILADTIGLAPAAAGAGSSLFQLFAVAGALGVPAIVHFAGVRVAQAIIGALWLAVPIGLLLVPDGWMLWNSASGIAQGGAFTIVVTLIVGISRSGPHSLRLSAFVQGFGYLAGASAPTLLGAVHEATGSWTLPLVLVLIAVSAFAVIGAVATHRATYRGTAAARP